MSDNPSLEDALEQLKQIVKDLETGDHPLDEAMRLFEEGLALVRHCQNDLASKELKVQQLLDDDTLSQL